jgi:hypothetical protein
MPDNIDKTKLLDPKWDCSGITLFYMNHGDHYGIANDYWGKKVRFFKFALCFHEWQPISATEAGKPAFNCYNYYKCNKCGAQHEQDSSD